MLCLRSSAGKFSARGDDVPVAKPNLCLRSGLAFLFCSLRDPVAKITFPGSGARNASQFGWQAKGSASHRIHFMPIAPRWLRKKRKNLAVLEAENYLIRFKENSARAEKMNQAAILAEKLLAKLRERFDPRSTKVSLDEVLNAGALAVSTRLDANEATYRALLDLATLERASGGAYRLELEWPEGNPGRIPARGGWKWAGFRNCFAVSPFCFPGRS